VSLTVKVSKKEQALIDKFNDLCKFKREVPESILNRYISDVVKGNSKPFKKSKGEAGGTLINLITFMNPYFSTYKDILKKTGGTPKDDLLAFMRVAVRESDLKVRKK
jgi:hypothetical protein